MEARLLLTMGNIAAVGGAALTAVDVIIPGVGDSNAIAVIGSDITTSLPAGYWGANDGNAFIWDDRTTDTIIPFKYATYATGTVTIATPAVVTQTAHGLANGDPVTPTTTGALPTGLTAGTVYYVANKATNTYQLATTYANAIAGTPVVATTGTQSGTHTFSANVGLEQQPNDAISYNSSYPRATGSCGEALRQYRIDNPSSAVYFFNFLAGGGSFTDAHGTGRAVNFTTTLSDGACVTLLDSWTRFVAALAAQSKRPNVIYARISGPGNGAFDATLAEANSYQADKTAFLSWFRSNIIGASAKIVLERISVTQTALVAGAVTIMRAADQAIVAAVNDKTLIEMTNADSFLCGTDNVHFDVASQIEAQKVAYYCGTNRWHPANQWAFQSQTPMAGRLRFGDLRNAPAAAAAGTAITTIFEQVAAKNPTLAATKQALLTNTTLANGYTARTATFDGSNDIARYTTSAPIGTTVGIYAALSAPATASKSAFSQGGTSSNTLILYLASAADGSGKIRFFARNDNNTTAGDLTSPSLVAFNGVMNAIDVEETAGSVVFRVNGAADSAQTYTRGTLTPNRYSVGGGESGGSESFQMNANIGEIWWTATPYSVAGDITGARTYRQREYGTV